MIDLYYCATPNGLKLRLFLEEVELAHRLIPVDIAKGEQFDVVYVDPPYDADLYKTILQLLGLSELVAEDGVVVVERWSRDRLPAEAGSLRHYRDVRHGNSTLAFYERI